MSNISLIVGLGNPGSEYAQTRHNAGFWFVEQLADKYGITLKNDPKFHGISGRGNIEGHDVRLLLPMTYMNRSGQSVVPFSKFYQIAPEAILIAHDELDMNPGVIRLKTGGGTAVITVYVILSRILAQIFIVYVLVLDILAQKKEFLDMCSGKHQVVNKA